MADHLATVQSIYEAFGRGDIPAILATLAEDVRWEDWQQPNDAQRAGVPWLQPLRGRENVVKFFEIVGTFRFNEFEVVSMLAGSDRVAVQLLVDITVPSGARFRDEELHLWVFDDSGKIVSFRHYLDTAKHIAVAGLSA